VCQSVAVLRLSNYVRKRPAACFNDRRISLRHVEVSSQHSGLNAWCFLDSVIFATFCHSSPPGSASRRFATAALKDTLIERDLGLRYF